VLQDRRLMGPAAKATGAIGLMESCGGWRGGKDPLANQRIRDRCDRKSPRDDRGSRVTFAILRASCCLATRKAHN